MKDDQTIDISLAEIAALDLDRVNGGYGFVPQTLTGTPKQMPARQLWDSRRPFPGRE